MVSFHGDDGALTSSSSSSSSSFVTDRNFIKVHAKAGGRSINGLRIVLLAAAVNEATSHLDLEITSFQSVVPYSSKNVSRKAKAAPIRYSSRCPINFLYASRDATSSDCFNIFFFFYCWSELFLLARVTKSSTRLNSSTAYYREFDLVL